MSRRSEGDICWLKRQTQEETHNALACVRYFKNTLKLGDLVYTNKTRTVQTELKAFVNARKNERVECKNHFGLLFLS